MTVAELKAFLIWSTVVNYGVLFLWFGAFSLAHDRVYRMHSRWFRLSVEQFDVLHYTGVTVYKIGIILLNVAPLVALYIVF